MAKKPAAWIDISQPLNNDVAHWPGDTPFAYELAYTKEQTGSVNIGRITTSLHTGTHIDAPFHFNDNGLKVIDLDINTYVGRALVIDCSHLEKIGKEQLEDYPLQGAERLLIKTAVPNCPNVFPDRIIPLLSDIGPFLREKGIFLLGVDVPSVDKLDSKELAVHHSLHEHDVHILENIMLDNILPGMYDLIALPLPIEGADGSPVRAVIRPVSTDKQ